MDNTFKWDENTAIEFADFMKTFIYPSAYEAGVKAFKKSKQPKPEWEILLCQLDNNSNGSVHSYQPDKCLGKSSTLPPCHIYSVKRLSDGEVFTIGDTVDEKVSGTPYPFVIKEFSLKDTRCFTCGININYIEKVPQPKPLFKTEDGIPKFKGDECWYWDSKEGGKPSKWYSLPEPLMLSSGKDISHYKYFSTKEAAEQYILENKPCLSLNDILNNSIYNKEQTVKFLPFLHLHFDIIKELVQSKLKS